ncbi:MAG: sigma-70 family RNA polymerase sigma factor [Deltaproteobacteria bacterium]|nr:sigma-70 family RNA polymerase sigma factor [Deltaproteobacteria bacterium]
MSRQKTKKKSSDLVKRASIRLANSTGEWVQGQEKSDSLYASFVRQATSIPRLSEEEERALGLKVKQQQDSDAAKKLVYHNMRLAIKMAHQYRRSWTNTMDLIQEALIGMGIASKRWGPDEGARFGTYAAYWIKARLTKFLMTNSHLIHTANSRAGRKIYFALPQIRRKLNAKGLKATPENIARELDESPEEVSLVLSRLENQESSLSTPIGDIPGNRLQDTIASKEETPESKSAQQEIRRTIEKLTKEFESGLTNKRDKAIWKRHLIAQEPTNLAELGREFGVSKQRMGQLSDRIKKSFRQHVVDTLGPDTQLSWLFNEDSIEWGH